MLVAPTVPAFESLQKRVPNRIQMRLIRRKRRRNPDPHHLRRRRTTCLGLRVMAKRDAEAATRKVNIYTSYACILAVHHLLDGYDLCQMLAYLLGSSPIRILSMESRPGITATHFLMVRFFNSLLGIGIEILK